MLKFTLLRIAQALPVLLVVITTTFFLVRMAPGGPFDAERALPADVLAKLEQRYQLDQPVLVQYANYMGNLLRGDFGPSYRYANRSVTEMIASGLPITFELAAWAILVALVFGVLAGFIAALRPNSWQDHSSMAIAMAGICLPSFLMGPLLVLVFGIWLEWLPVSGWGYQAGDKVLPVITLASGYAAYIARLSRAGLLEELGKDYIRTARAKGLSMSRVLLVHALRGGLAPVVAFAGPALAGLLAGSFVVETIFQIPGLGRFYVQAAFNRDYTMILGSTILLSALIIAFNALSDIVTAWMNPRMKLKT
ncbi:MAG: ABC transporter permease subunit [Gammaproteobacteria bacterium]|nr:ABC transporter permease subunit [Gammaproteobacteria bacterium]MBT8151136.1 ABC transporter permease subunit [Gammaproteobacteria bacterium]NND38126.1 ABC transporter permease subunit [Pseudomonadales bacterium]NNL10871.1 ABC transporter permease subunit [Pseudomonadales bacterium]RZV56090.1 MAG: ABC transporter permease subunit [Pseudomonadales bacterium]